MARHILLLRDGYKLTPADPQSFELIEGLKEGKVYSVEIKESRSRGELNLYWAGIGLLIENLSDEDTKKWPTSRHYHEAMLDSLGYTYRLWRVDGTFRSVIDSIAIDKMGDADFKVLFEKVRAITEQLFGWSPWDKWLEIRGTDWQAFWGRNWRPGDKD